MKKLSQKSKVNSTPKVLSKKVDEIIIEDGFSGFICKDGTKIKGSCASCSSQPCIKYTTSDIEPIAFRSFEKNPTNRVCPTHAIQINENGCAVIDSKLCIRCGLCLHRCPFSAIQFSILQDYCTVSSISESKYLIESTPSDQETQIAELSTLPKVVKFDKITQTFCSDYQQQLRNSVKKVPDLSEIIVRNSFINLGCPCATKPAGNNHIRTEFFAQIEDKAIIGESEITNTDTLSVCRRILDDLSVLISRNGFKYDDLIPVAVINGLPNKRTDFYEVITDINNILGIQISTITYYLLFVLNLFNIPLTISDLKKYVVGKENFSLVEIIQTHISDIMDIDANIEDSGNYQPSK